MSTLLPVNLNIYIKMIMFFLSLGRFVQKHAIVWLRLNKPTLDPDDLNSYPPISNLSFLSKTIERVVTIRFNEHVEAYNLLPSRQSAFRAHHSTETAVIDVHNRIVRNMDRGGHASVLVLLDLSSAFDTVDHAILLAVLEKRFWVTGIALKWYWAYVNGRAPTFQVGSQLSATFVVHCSVPQGSVLEALKFVTYTEDQPAVIQRLAIDHHLYADDTQAAQLSHPSRHPSRKWSTVSTLSTPGALRRGSS